MIHKPSTFIVDVDGVMTDGHFYYTTEGKVMKKFGPDDHDGLSLLKSDMDIIFVTGDSKGFPISQKRISDDMKFPLELVSTVKRVEWIKSKYDPAKVVYMGDGIFDHYVFRAVGYSIAPADADINAIKNSDYVTTRNGGNRAVAEACLHLLETFFIPYDPLEELKSGVPLSGQWGV